MQSWLSDQARLFVLLALCTMLWSLESVVPLNRYRKHRLRRALPNIAFTLLLILTNLLLSFATAQLVSFAQSHRLGLLFLIDLSPWLVPLIGIMGLDLFAYLAHVLLHKSWLGWQFHRVHHSESEVDVTTAFRQHPGETLWRILWQLLAIVVLGLPLWVVVLYLMISAVNAQLEHANIRINAGVDRWLRLLVVTPNMHKVHHSREQQETDSNYANIFSLWDRLGGTYTAQVDFQKLRFGLDGFDSEERQSFGALLRLPFAP
ncbi:MAG TPA: sterol desaturase family protein [Pyrinomonadaceae bacterium]|nr:sterol desaturase family protein [Pyrinomonadaceae bacterium]